MIYFCFPLDLGLNRIVVVICNLVREKQQKKPNDHRCHLVFVFVFPDQIQMFNVQPATCIWISSTNDWCCDILNLVVGFCFRERKRERECEINFFFHHCPHMNLNESFIMCVCEYVLLMVSVGLQFFRCLVCSIFSSFFWHLDYQIVNVIGNKYECVCKSHFGW